MADLQQKYDLDLRFGGSTLGDFAYFYDVELPYLYNCLNALRKNQVSPAGDNVEPAPNQFKVDDGGIFVRDADNQSWIFLMSQAYKGGFLAQGETMLKSTDKPASSSVADRANKLAVYDAYGNLPCNIDGSANAIAGHGVDANGVQDGQVLSYNAGLGKWEPTDKFSGVGSGKSLALVDSHGVIASYNGGATVSADVPVRALLPDTGYNVGDVANTNQLSSSMMLVCVHAGTTPASLPSLG